MWATTPTREALLSDSLDMYADQPQPNARGRAAEKKFSQRGMTVDHKNMPTQSWANNLREGPAQRPRTVTPTSARAASLSPGRGHLRSTSPRRSPSPHRLQDPYSPRWASPSPRARSPASSRNRNSRVPYVVQGQRHHNRGGTMPSPRSTSPRSTRSYRGTANAMRTGGMRHGTPPKLFGDAPKLKSGTYLYSPSSGRLDAGGRMSPGRTSARQRKRKESLSSAPSWLDDEERKLSQTLQECNRETQREWVRMQRSHPELKKVPMPGFGGSSHDKMWAEVKWMLKRKVEEQDARAKRMAQRIQRLEGDAELADKRRNDLERAMSSMTKSHEKDLADMLERIQLESSSVAALKREKEVLLDELDVRGNEMEQMQATISDLKKTEESTSKALSTAMASRETSAAEAMQELKLAKQALEEERERTKDVERGQKGKAAEAQAKIVMMESQLTELRQFSADLEGEIERLRAEIVKAHQETDAEKLRSAHAINEMQKKLNVWSEEGALAIQEARLAAEEAERKAKAHEREVERDAKATLHDLEMRVEAQTEQLRKEAEKARREERNDLLRKAASEKIAVEAKLKDELENLRTEMEQQAMEERTQMENELKREIERYESKLKAETEKCKAKLDYEIEKHRKGLASVERDLEAARRASEEKNEFKLNSEAEKYKAEIAAVRRELATAQHALQEADEKHEEYEKVLEAATESHDAMKISKDRSEQASSMAKEDVKMLKKMVSTLQVELAGKPCNPRLH